MVGISPPAWDGAALVGCVFHTNPQSRQCLTDVPTGCLGQTRNLALNEKETIRGPDGAVGPLMSLSLQENCLQVFMRLKRSAALSTSIGPGGSCSSKPSSCPGLMLLCGK